MNKRIQKKMHKKVFEKYTDWCFVGLNKPEERYVRLFKEQWKSREVRYRQLQEQAMQRVANELKERQNMSNERTKAIVDKLVDVEVKIREVFENV